MDSIFDILLVVCPDLVGISTDPVERVKSYPVPLVLDDLVHVLSGLEKD
jgi:hypothetical protein